MDWLKTLKKAVLGFLTFLTASIAVNPSILTNLIPEDIAAMTVKGAVAAVLVALANWLKHKDN